jgi:hypothetical protein
MTTTDDLYGDGADHEVCEECHHCIECGDCEEYGCGAGVLHSLVPTERS